MLTPEERKLDMMRHLGIAPPAPSAPPPRARIKLPPQRAACGVLMDGDRLPAHMAQCVDCAKAGGVLQVSLDGQSWVNYSGSVEGLKRFPPGGSRCLIPRPRTDDSGNMERIVKGAPVEVPMCQKRGCARLGVRPAVDGLWLCDLDGAKYALWRSEQSGASGILRDSKHPELLSHNPLPLAHSYGIEDPALPNA